MLHTLKIFREGGISRASEGASHFLIIDLTIFDKWENEPSYLVVVLVPKLWLMFKGKRKTMRQYTVREVSKCVLTPHATMMIASPDPLVPATCMELGGLFITCLHHRGRPLNYTFTSLIIFQGKLKNRVAKDIRLQKITKGRGGGPRIFSRPVFSGKSGRLINK